MSQKSDFYVYALCDPREVFEDDRLAHRPFYIGKGRGDRCKTHIKEANGYRKPAVKDSLKNEYLTSLVESGNQPLLVLVQTDLREDEAYDFEVALIKRYGRIGYDKGGILTNRLLDQRAYAHKGYRGKRPPRTAEHIERQKASRKGFRYSEQSRRKMAASKLGRILSEETRAKMRSSHAKRLATSRTWIIVTPTGQHQVGSMKQWCKDNKVHYWDVFHGRNGYSKRKIDDHGHLDSASPKIIGLVTIQDFDTKEILMDTTNAVNFEAMSYALALSLADRPNGAIMEMLFGNGASSVSAVGTVTYLPPNVTGLDATLYNQTYSKFVNDLSPLDTDPTDNFIRVNHTTGNTFSDVVVNCLLDYNEPSGQAAFDDTTDVTGTFVFDEIGLSTFDPSSSLGYLLSHVIFHPVQKSLNRRIEIIYTIRIILV